MIEDVTSALARLDRAVARLQGALEARSSGHVTIATAYAQLDERHGQLRARVQDTIARLDAMIDDAG